MQCKDSRDWCKRRHGECVGSHPARSPDPRNNMDRHCRRVSGHGEHCDNSEISSVSFMFLAVLSSRSSRPNSISLVINAESVLEIGIIAIDSSPSSSSSPPPPSLLHASTRPAKSGRLSRNYPTGLCKSLRYHHSPDSGLFYKFKRTTFEVNLQ